MNSSGSTADIAEVSAGGNHTCAVTTGGGVKCWGDDFDGELGDGTTGDTTGDQICKFCRATPVDVSGLTNGVVAVSAGGIDTCALTSGGGVKCWGSNNYGELGNGTATGPQSCSVGVSLPGFACGTSPVDVTGLNSGAAAISVGGDHTCAVTTSGAVERWDLNSRGRLGEGTPIGQETCSIGQQDFPCSSVPVGVVGLTSGAASVSAGDEHTCALTTGGGVKCWGINMFGQLGDGSFSDSTTPVDVVGLTSGVKAIAAGGEHTCALTTAGGVKCWGLNFVGELGIGTNSGPPFCFAMVGSCSNVPMDVTDLSSGVAGVAAGGQHACAVTAEGDVKCWGGNSLGQLADGTTTDRFVPAQTVSTPPFGAGDVNCDGSITAVDAYLSLLLNANVLLSLPCGQNVDANGDGMLNAVDAELTLQYDAGLIHTLSTAQPAA